MSTSSATKANIQATRRAACNTGNRDTAPGSLTIIYPKGGEYHMETANQRHIRECVERAQAARVAAGITVAAVAVAKVAKGASAASKAASALAKAISKRKGKPTRKVARLVAGVATVASRAPRSAASKARDARYQWLRRRLRKLGFAYVAALPGSTVLAAMEATWLLLQA